MYFIVGKTINQNKQVLSYLITDGEGIKEVAPQQVYVEYQKGSLSYLKGFNSNTGEVDFKNIDNSLIPTFYNGSGINNNASVLKIITDNNSQVGVRILAASGKIMNVSLSNIVKLVSGKKVQLFNAKIVNNKVVMKYADTTVAKASGGGNKEEVTINNYDKSKFVIENLRLIRYTGNDKEVIIPKGVTSIEGSAFEGCTSLKSINIPDSVTSIGIEAFYDCTSLTSITIPDSVTSIGEYAFAGCSSFTSITIPNSVTSIEESVFDCCTSLTSVIIPDSVTNIGKHAFDYCTSLTSIMIPNSVTSIGDYAFAGCTSLKSINIPDSVTSIGGRAFCSCTRLTSVTIGNSVASIEDRAFDFCENLTSIIIPDSMTSIGSYAFSGCTNLTSINIPNSVTSIGKCAFNKWTSSQTINIKGRGKAPYGWEKYWNKACNAKIVWDVESDNTIVASGGCGEYGYNVRWQLDNKGLLVISGSGEMKDYVDSDDVPWVKNRKYIETVIIKKGVTSIGIEAFYDCTSLTSITIPDSVTSIEDYAFYCCTSLKSITIPDSVTSIGIEAFYDCMSLTSINIPDSVTSIGSGAFCKCMSLTSITIPDSVTSIGDRAFRYWRSSQTIYIKGRSYVPSEWDSEWNIDCNAKIVWRCE